MAPIWTTAEGKNGTTLQRERHNPRMSLVRMSPVGLKTFAALLAVVASSSLYTQTAFAADTKRPPVPAVAKPPVPTGAELVGKLLAEQNGPSDPDVPLPQRGLSRAEPASTPLSGPQMFGRREDGGGVFGLKIPIPVTRSAF